MIRRGRTLALFLASTVLLAGSPGGAGQPAPDETSIPDREIGLARGSVFEVPDPDPRFANQTEPGEGSPLPRPFVGAPPRVSHNLADLLPITRDENLCIDCHLIAEAGEGDPTPIPQSHRIDLRNAPGVVGEGVVGARYYCTTCHVETTEARPLLGTGSAPPAAPG